MLMKEGGVQIDREGAWPKNVDQHNNRGQEDSRDDNKHRS